LGKGTFGTNTSTTDPQCETAIITVSGLSGVTQLASGGNFNCAVLNTGAVQCWGENNFGQLGNGGGGNQNLPVTVAGLGGNAVEVKTGTQHACARLTSGLVKCWGRNHYGQLGNNSTATSPSPVSVGAGLGSVAEISVGGEFSCGRRASGTVACWGANYVGQLGLGTVDNNMPHNPATALNVTGAVQIASGWYHTCVVRGTGQTMCWGLNAQGQTGAGNTSSPQATPFNLLNINDGTNFGMGERHTCLRRKSGSLTCWGSNEFGQIGNGAALPLGKGVVVLSPFTVPGVP
jgi:alpha-tubulin suppressor-like RCC1 family protein